MKEHHHDTKYLNLFRKCSKKGPENDHFLLNSSICSACVV